MSAFLTLSVCVQDAEEQIIREEPAIAILELKFPDIVQMYSNEIDVTERVASDGASFSTDSEISRKDVNNLYGRTLESASSWLGDGDDGGLGDGSSKGGKWNQFEANKELFGVESTYDENLYTTALKKTDLSDEQRLKAERIAAEIEGTVDSNPHMQEERGQKVADDGMDEEDRYSSVLGNRGGDKKAKETEDKKQDKDGEKVEKKKSTLKAPKSALKVGAAEFVPSWMKTKVRPLDMAPCVSCYGDSRADVE
jgi:PAB1-binding protein PBP1